MAHNSGDRIHETWTGTGTGDISLAGANSPGQTFVNGVGTGNRCNVAIANRSANEWECQRDSLVTDASPDTLSRIAANVVDGSSGPGVLVNFGAGTKDVFVSRFSDLAKGENLLINGGFDFFQRQTPGTETARSDDTYGPDRWNILTQTAAINCSRSAGTNTPWYGLFKQNQVAAQRFGICQIIEYSRCRHLRSKFVRFQLKVQASAIQPIRVAILEWTGTADTVTSDVVNDWTSSDYGNGAAKFFVDANYNVIATASISDASAGLTDIYVTGTVGASMNNIVVVVWTEGTAAQNFLLATEGADFYEGLVHRDWQPRPLTVEQALCERYYEKTFSIDTIPTQGIGVFGMSLIQTGPASTGQTLGSSWTLRVPKRVSPTVTLYNTSAANAQIRNISTGTDYTLSTIAASYDNIIFTGTSPAGSAKGDHCSVHAVAECEL